ncbi:DUF1702 family protein [Nonomuraea sp. NPDC005983]|uniref:DUF1702 family protein n=1 Tax=Nonomuraea sp. NPDC005983 TaxID=3155595 RepID=UPI0033B13DAF
MLFDQVGTEATPPPVRGLRRFLVMDEHASDLGRRRFRQGAARHVLEDAEKNYVFGFNAVLSRDVPRIDDISLEQRGFAYEGAAAACAALDLLTLGRGRRLRALLDGPALHFQQAAHLGAGRGHALLRVRPLRGVKGGHPLLRWLAMDGFGFQLGLTQTDRLVGERSLPDLPTRAHCALFDQGLGRLLWYHDCASPDDLAITLAGYPASRRGDLWIGLGFAATYVGGAGPDGLWRLAEHAGADGFRPHLAQGCAFAAASMTLGERLPDHVELAVPILAGTAAEDAGAWVAGALSVLDSDPYTHDEFLAWQAHTRRAWKRRHPD